MEGISQLGESAAGSPELSLLKRVLAHILAKWYVRHFSLQCFTASLVCFCTLLDPQWLYGPEEMRRGFPRLLIACVGLVLLLAGVHLRLRPGARPLRIWRGVMMAVFALCVIEAVTLALAKRLAAVPLSLCSVFVACVLLGVRDLLKHMGPALDDGPPESLVKDTDRFVETILRQGQKTGDDYFEFRVWLSTERLAGKLSDGWGLVAGSTKRALKVFSPAELTIEPPVDVEPGRVYRRKIFIAGAKRTALMPGLSYLRLWHWAARYAGSSQVDQI